MKHAEAVEQHLRRWHHVCSVIDAGDRSALSGQFCQGRDAPL